MTSAAKTTQRKMLSHICRRSSSASASAAVMSHHKSAMLAKNGRIASSSFFSTTSSTSSSSSSTSYDWLDDKTKMYKNFINGKYATSASALNKDLVVNNPATNEIIGYVPETTEDEFNKAVEDAQSFFENEWKYVPIQQKQRIMMKYQQKVKWIYYSCTIGHTCVFTVAFVDNFVFSHEIFYIFLSLAIRPLPFYKYPLSATNL